MSEHLSAQSRHNFNNTVCAEISVAIGNQGTVFGLSVDISAYVYVHSSTLIPLNEWRYFNCQINS